MNHKNFIAFVTALALGIAGFSAVPAHAGNHLTNQETEAQVYKADGTKFSKSKHKKHVFGHSKARKGKGQYRHVKRYFHNHGKLIKKRQRYGHKKYYYGNRYTY